MMIEIDVSDEIRKAAFFYIPDYLAYDEKLYKIDNYQGDSLLGKSFVRRHAEHDLEMRIVNNWFEVQYTLLDSERRGRFWDFFYAYESNGKYLGYICFWFASYSRDHFDNQIPSNTGYFRFDRDLFFDANLVYERFIDKNLASVCDIESSSNCIEIFDNDGKFLKLMDLKDEYVKRRIQSVSV